MSDDSVRGRFVWHELMTTDPKVARDFYSRVVGWKPQAFPQDPSYTVLTTKDGNMAGLMMLPEEARSMGAPPSWLVYVGVANVDDIVSQAEDMGAKTLKEPTDIPEIGRFAVLQDPQGAVFAVFTPVRGSGEERREPERVPLGDFSWHELITTDWQSDFEFYRKLFGWEKTESMDMGPGMGVYQMFGWGGKTVGGMFNKPKEMPAPPHWLPYVMVADVHRAAELVTKLGGRVVNGPMEVPGGDWIVQFLDPQGALFALHSARKAETGAEVGGGAEAGAPRPQAEKPTRRRTTTAARTPGMKPAPKAPEKAPAKAPAAKKSTKKAAKKATKKAAKKGAGKAAKKAARKTATRKTAARKTPARKTTARKTTTRKTTTRKTTVRKTSRPGRKSPGKASRKGSPKAARPVRKSTRKAGRKSTKRSSR